MEQIYFSCLYYKCTLTVTACKKRQLKMNDEVCLSCGKMVVSKKEHIWLKSDTQIKVVKIKRCRTNTDVEQSVFSLLVGQCIEVPILKVTKLQQNTIHNIGRKLKRIYKTSKVKGNRMIVTRIQ